MPINSSKLHRMTWKPKINTKASVLYLSLAEKLEKDILNGSLLPGTKLPPQRNLAAYLNINVSTISKAFKVCEAKGLLSATVGSGTFVSFDALSNACSSTNSKIRHPIDLSTVAPDSSPYYFLKTQLQDMLHDNDFEKWFSYGSVDDISWQKDAAVQYIEKNGHLTYPETILFAGGTQHAITAALAALCSYGDKIGTTPHTCEGLKSSANMLGVNLIPIMTEYGEMSEEGLISACRNNHIKGIYLTPDCHNPTTHIMSLARRQSLARIALEYNIFIIENATHHMMCQKSLPSIAAFAPEQTIYIAGLSETIAPGLRLAYLSVPKSYRQPVSAALYHMNESVTPLMADLTARTIVSKQLDHMIQMHKEAAIYRNQLLDYYFADYDCAGEKTSFFRWLKLPAFVTGLNFEKAALAYGVQICAAERFTLNGVTPENAIRICTGTPSSISDLARGFILLQHALHSFEK